MVNIQNYSYTELVLPGLKNTSDTSDAETSELTNYITRADYWMYHKYPQNMWQAKLHFALYWMCLLNYM